jgi:hypothetical protein
MAKYIQFGLTLSKKQKEKIVRAVQNGGGPVVIRLAAQQLTGEDKLALTPTQIARIKKRKGKKGVEITLSKTQLKDMMKTGGILPLIPLILGGLSAVGALSGGAAAIAKTVFDKKAKDVENAEIQRHHRALESELKSGGCCPMCKGSGLFLSKN